MAMKNQRSVWYLAATREEARRIVKDGFPPEPTHVKCMVREHEVWQKTSGGENTPWAVKITFKKGTILPVDPKRDVALGIPVEHLNAGKRKIELKILGATPVGVT